MGGVKVGPIQSLGEYLREQRRNAEMSVRQLAERAGVSNPYLSQVERGLRKPSAEVLSQLAKALQISAEAIYIRAGLLDPDEAPEDGNGAKGRAGEDADRAVEAAIQADRELTTRHKRTLLDILASFRREAEQVRQDQEPTGGPRA